MIGSEMALSSCRKTLYRSLGTNSVTRELSFRMLGHIVGWATTPIRHSVEDEVIEGQLMLDTIFSYLLGRTTSRLVL